MKTILLRCVFILLTLSTCLSFAQTKKRTRLDTLLYLTFKQKLERATKYDCEHISLKISDLDTINKTFAVDLEFLFSQKALSLMVNTLTGAEEKPKDKFHISMKSSFYCDPSDSRFIISDSAVKVTSINGKPITKELYVTVGFEVGKMCPGLYLYFEITPNDWYFFKYGCGKMEAVSSNKLFNNVLLKEKHKSCYTYQLTAPFIRNRFLSEVERTCN